ncbi:MAG: hypothetical protein ABFS42_15740 [Candidatus Krumholzibacteriota bacterium]
MNDGCLKPDELADLTADDPRLAHVEECPRCRAVMMSYQAFMDPADIPAGADLDDAQVRLSAALEQEMEVVRPAPTFWTPFRVRTFAAAAAVLIVAVGLSLFGGGPEVISTDGPVLRGVGASAELFRIDMSKQENGEFWVSWPAIDEATGYRVVIYGEDLEPILGYDAESATAYKFEPPAGAAFCRVIAFRDGDEIGKSDPWYFDDC